MSARPELSVVIPCRNEQDTVQAVIQEIHDVLAELAVSYEIIVADNDSTDQSAQLAAGVEANVIHVALPGYGHALSGGINQAGGEYVLLCDADGSYAPADAERILQRLRQGDHLVLGCRLPGGGGTVQSGAMPLLHRLIGNPILSWVVRRLLRIQVHDIYCGLRGFSARHYRQLAIEHPGMPFATEMVIKFALAGFRVSEVPVTLRPDGRINTRSHLRTFYDGWSTLSLIFACWWAHRRGRLRVRRGHG